MRLPFEKCRQDVEVRLLCSMRINPEYHLRVTSAGFMPGLCRRFMRFRSMCTQGDARFADARMSCDPIAGAFLSGPSCCRFSCGHSVADNAAPGTWVCSSGRDESRIQKSLPLEILTRNRIRHRRFRLRAPARHVDVLYRKPREAGGSRRACSAA
jgi:hypothetical protein